MTEKFVLGEIGHGLKTDTEAWVIDNDSFPVLVNAYQWRRRVKRKRGTSPLNRLQRYFDSTNVSYLPTPDNTIAPSTAPATLTLSGGAGNLLGPYTTFNGNVFSLESTGNILSTYTVITSSSAVVYTDPAGDGTLSPSGTINYATGAFALPAGEGSNTVTVQMIYYPGLPVMGLRNLTFPGQEYPGNLAFDTTYSYNFTMGNPPTIYDVSWYKNPPSSAGYTPKTTPTPISWNGTNYQQFWTVNYEGALWATNGINVPFSPSSLGMQFAPTVAITYISNTATTITLEIDNCPLIIGDFVFFNEWTGTGGLYLNLKSGYVTAASGGYATNTITVTLPSAGLPTAGSPIFTPGIVQYLTNRQDPTVDCIRWYDGDPTNENPFAEVLDGHLGWVNYCPPLSIGAFNIANDTPAQYYLIGCRVMFPYKDRMLFFGPVVQTSFGTKLYLQDTIIYTQNGTPYYTASFTGLATNPGAATTITSLLVPKNQTAFPWTMIEDQFGYGGNYTTGVNQPILSVNPNEDVLILGYSNKQARLVYTGDDLLPFNVFIINSEFGTSSTFSVVTLDRGVISRGNQGFIITSQVSAERIDTDIPDQVFEIGLLNNGPERICSVRDFINEWIYFTYLDQNSPYIFPSQTLLYNYRDNSWGVFNENFTTYGIITLQAGLSWNEIPWQWDQWFSPWNSGEFQSLQPVVMGGNQQGFVLQRNSDVTAEAPSLSITSFSGNTITSPNHCLNSGDYIQILGCLGTIGTNVNGKVFQVQASPTASTFTIDISPTGTYFGQGTITRMYVPVIQTKQFPLGWQSGRKTRLGAQQYLFTNSNNPNSHLTMQIYLSQNQVGPTSTAYNSQPIVPALNVTNSSLEYSDVIITGPELYVQTCTSIPLGKVGNGSSTSFVFDFYTMYGLINTNLVAGSIFIKVGSLATFTDNGTGGFIVTGTGDSTGSSIVYSTGIVTIAFASAPVATSSTTNFQYYMPDIQSPTAMEQEAIWHRVNTSLIGDTIQIGFTLSNDQMLDPGLNNQFSEIEFHGLVIDVSPSQLLS